MPYESFIRKVTLTIQRPDNKTPWGIRLGGGKGKSTPLTVELVRII